MHTSMAFLREQHPECKNFLAQHFAMHWFQHAHQAHAALQVPTPLPGPQGSIQPQEPEKPHPPKQQKGF